MIPNYATDVKLKNHLPNTIATNPVKMDYKTVVVPANKSKIDNTERKIKNVEISDLKHGVKQTQNALKKMLLGGTKNIRKESENLGVNHGQEPIGIKNFVR